MRIPGMLALALSLMMASLAPVLAADVEVPLVIEKKQFHPAEVKVRAGAPFVLVITNKDAAAAEFESKELRVEKVVPAGKTVKVRVRALQPGKYAFVDDFNKQATGRLVAE